MLRAIKTELEAEGGVLRTTDEYVDALISYKIRRLVRKHVLAASALTGAGASGAALLGQLLQHLPQLPRTKSCRATKPAPPAWPPPEEQPPGESEEEPTSGALAASASSEGCAGGRRGALHGLGQLIGSGPGVVLGAALACAFSVMRAPPEGRPRRDRPMAGRRAKAT